MRFIPMENSCTNRNEKTPPPLPLGSSAGPKRLRLSGRLLVGMAFSEADRARFARLMGRPDANGCRPWLGSCGTEGYGRVGISSLYLGAHRVAYAMHVGLLKDGYCVCHTCDNPICVEPTHLWLGTRADNAADRHAKGRDASGDRSGPRLHPEKLPRGDANYMRMHPEIARGESNPRHKLTELQVLEIRASPRANMTALARRYGVTEGAIRHIFDGTRWRHLP